jgi:acyl transferase domain-containing protein/NAD(P)H-dependent flavin oxidoreductase YrpB (nitropropane dioxygenase family)
MWCDGARVDERYRILGLSPFDRAVVQLTAECSRAGAMGVLELAVDDEAGRRALSELSAAGFLFGVRLSARTATLPLTLPLTLPDNVGALVLPDVQVLATVAEAVAQVPDRRRPRLLCQVCSLHEARRAIELGADGLIVKGNESGGRVGDETSFVLVQRVVAEIAAPLWVQGGIGLHSAAAAIAAGAFGVVLDAQLALLPSSGAPRALRKRLAKLDGSETSIHEGSRVLRLLMTGEPDLVVPMGQDVALAADFAKRYGTMTDVVRGVLGSLDGHLRCSQAVRVLQPESAFAKAAGIRFPIAQGPMTRVSDASAFAEAVADAGALPFIALALLRQNEASAILEDTHRRLAGRSYGVGLLGFAPPEIRAEQLALVERLRPPFALIAGGRPAQAQALEAVGVATFLHVPSPGLLELFLREGARRFVFEGRECGGHVGPRSSFLLWEQAVAQLTKLPDLNDVHVLFAGGIHDARSAAAVAALSAPLAARGAKIGVLMGTAYLFTREAVEHGAITAEFQNQAFACEQTVLLESGPGHATRAAFTPFAEEFQRARREMQAAHRDPQEMWLELEQMNLGRLRVAAKGLERTGASLVAVDQERQRDQGLFMMGQVAALRREQTTLAELHADVSERSAQTLANAVRPSQPLVGGDDIAIVGMACVLPGAENIEQYLCNLLSGCSSVTEVPESRWNRTLYFDTKGGHDKTRSKWGGFIPQVRIDAQRYGIPPRSVGSVDPGQLLSLHVVEQALVDADLGLDEDPLARERTAVVFGAEAGTEMASAYVFRCAYPQLLGALPDALDAQLPKLTEDALPGVLANVITGRISNRFDLGGSNYTVNAACASSLTALDAACKELTLGSADVAIAGAVDVHNGAYDYLMFSAVQALSPTGSCKAFDAAADGTVLGEGVVAVVLKRRADAERDGNRIYATLRAVAGASDGRALGLTAPRREGQLRSLERTYARAGVSPADVSLFEAHGTGTVLGDRTELGTLTELLADAGATAGAHTLGSVKSQIGHTKCAAGLAGLLKVVLSAYHGILPPTAQLSTPHPDYRPGQSPLVFRERPAPWIEPRRLGAVSAFGFGGTNFHAVVEGRGDAVATMGWPVELFLLRGVDRQAALQSARALFAAADSSQSFRLRDLALTAERANEGERVQLALVAESLADLRWKLARALESGGPCEEVLASEPDPEASSGRDVAFLFPGQGSQRLHMGSDLFIHFPFARALLVGEPELARCLFPGRAFLPEEQGVQLAALTDTRVAQASLGLVELAFTDILRDFGVEAAFAGGHSYGELAALAYAGSLARRDLIALSRERAQAMHSHWPEHDAGRMAAVRASSADLAPFLSQLPSVVIANHNAPRQTVIAGPSDDVDRFVVLLREHGIGAVPLTVAGAFHSPLLHGADRSFDVALARTQVSSPRIAVFSNLTGAAHGSDPSSVRAALAQQLVSPVLFEQQVRAMHAAGARTFVEVGPGQVLTGLVQEILGAQEHRAISTDRRGAPSGLHALLEALAKLAVAGVPLTLTRSLESRGARSIALPLASRPSVQGAVFLVDGHCAKSLDGAALTEGLRPCDAPVAVARTEPGDSGDASLLEYLRSMRELAERQSDVMLRYLGAAPQRTNDHGIQRVVARAERYTALPSPAVAADTAGTVSDVLSLLQGIVSERTGYPIEMLDPDLDLEADFGIDSIKRAEIAGSLVQALGISGSQQSHAVERLVRVRTMRQMRAELSDNADRAGNPDIGTAQGSVARLPAERPQSMPVEEIQRLLIEPTITDGPHNGLSVRGLTYALVADDRGIAEALALILRARGAHVLELAEPSTLAAADALILLESLRAGANCVERSAFGWASRALELGVRQIVSVTVPPRDGVVGGAGIAGLLKSLAREHATLRVQTIELDPREDAHTSAARIAAELQDASAPRQVLFASEQRFVPTLVHAAHRSEAAQEPRAVLDRDSVVLVTGGARGITARLASALARRYGCKLEIVGRSELPAPIESTATASCPDIRALRRVLAESGASPRAIDIDCRRLLAEREMRTTFSELTAAGARFRYHALDVRDSNALAALIERIYAEQSRLDAVIHGAGVIDDRLCAEKSLESFDRVFDTKAASAHAILSALKPETELVVFLSSISAVLGNRGQTDYAAANAVLDGLALAADPRERRRVLSINWGPWSLGMVDDDLAAEYRRRQVALITPEAGVRAFIDELEQGRSSQVVLVAGGPEAWASDG